MIYIKFLTIFISNFEKQNHNIFMAMFIYSDNRNIQKLKKYETIKIVSSW